MRIPAKLLDFVALTPSHRYAGVKSEARSGGHQSRCGVVVIFGHGFEREGLFALIGAESEPVRY